MLCAILIIIFLVVPREITTTSVVIRGEKAKAICQATSSDPEQYLIRFSDPLDCTKYFNCQRISQDEFLAHVLQCPQGTSFLPTFLKGSCNGPDPKNVLDCFKTDSGEGTKWSEWSAWSTCSATCGDQATKQRSRLCISNFLEGHRQNCQGHAHEISTCLDLPSCRQGKALSTKDGEWSDFSAWSACSATCGDQATKQRSRLCISEAMGGKTCHGHSIEITSCLDLPKCDGKWSAWSTWSPCSATCGQATKHRSRHCTGQGACIGSDSEIDSCPNLPKCSGIFFCKFSSQFHLFMVIIRKMVKLV